MSRIGRMPITVPAGVEVTIAENNVVTVKGPKGTLTQALRPEMILEQEGNVIHVKRPSDDKLHCALHGMTRALLHNMVCSSAHWRCCSLFLSCSSVSSGCRSGFVLPNPSRRATGRLRKR